MVATGDMIEIEGGIDTAHTLIRRPLKVLSVYEDHHGDTMVDLGIESDGRDVRVVSGYSLKRTAEGVIDGLEQTNGSSVAKQADAIQPASNDSASRRTDRRTDRRVGGRVVAREKDSVSGSRQAMPSSDRRSGSDDSCDDSGNRSGVAETVQADRRQSDRTDPEARTRFSLRNNGAAGDRSELILAVDTMNILARSYHAGKPSNVHGVRGMFDTLKRLIEDLKPTHVVFAVEGGHKYRRDIFAGYKASRKPTEENLKNQIGIAHKAIEAIGWPLTRCENYEADDVLATIAKRYGRNVIVATTDKDLRQLATTCQVYHPYDRAFIGPAEVEAKFGVRVDQLGDWLALCGDKVDDVPGVPGIGPKTATERLKELDTLEAILDASDGEVAKKKPSKAWQNINQNKAAAMMSRKLVALVDDLPIELDLDSCFTVERPRAAWVDRWRDLELGPVSTRLAAVLASLVDVPEPPAAKAIPESQPIPYHDRIQNNTKSAGWNYTSGVDWAKKEPAIAARLRSGEATMKGFWGEYGESEAGQTFYRGAMGLPLEPVQESQKPAKAASLFG